MNMETMRNKKVRFKMPRVNMRLLPIKAHYFFFFGALGGVYNFLPIIGKDLGITATAMGVIYAILPFAVLFAKPLSGVIVDHFGNMKIMLVSLIFATATSFTLILFVAPLPKSSIQTFPMDCVNDTLILTLPLDCNNNKTLVNMSTTIGLLCNFTSPNGSHTCNFQSMSPSAVDFGKGRFFDGNLIQKLNGTQAGESPSCRCSLLITQNTMTCSPELEECYETNNKPSVGVNQYLAYQFWSFAALVILGCGCTAAVFCLAMQRARNSLETMLNCSVVNVYGLPSVQGQSIC